jgi:cytochrome c
MSDRGRKILYALLGAGWIALATVRAVEAPDVRNGRKIFAACIACHDPNQATKTGSDLRGVVGRKSGTVPGFRYSRAMKNAQIVWDEARLDAYLAEPQEVVPGNAMPYPGLPAPAERRDLIAYLKSLTPTDTP